MMTSYSRELQYDDELWCGVLLEPEELADLWEPREPTEGASGAEREPEPTAPPGVGSSGSS